MPSDELFLTDISVSQFTESSNTLLKHVKNKGNFFSQDRSYRNAIGVNIIQHNFATKNQRRSYFQDCNVVDTNFESAGYLGSTFRDTNFNNCNFKYGNFHSCSFEKVIFTSESISHTIESAGFHKSVFSETTFKNMSFFSCGFTDVLFNNCLFENCIFRLCSMENTVFNSCIFIDVSMPSQNLEYVQFENPHMERVLLPFAPLPYLFKGLKYILSAQESAKIGIYSIDVVEKQITPHAYNALMSDFINFHMFEKNYFPLANIYISNNNYDLAYQAIVKGVLGSLKIRDFRMLRHFCKVVYLNDIFTVKERQELLENIIMWAEIQSFRIGERYNYELNIGSIHQMLLYNNYTKPTLNIRLKSNIVLTSKLQLLLEVLEEILPSNNLNKHYIELHHNSPFEVAIIFISDNFYDVFKTIALTYASLQGTQKFINLISSICEKIQDAILRSDSHKKNKQEMILNNLLIEEKQRSIEKQSSEIEKLSIELKAIKDKSSNTEKFLNENMIQIYSINHHLSNVPHIVDSQFLNYHSNQTFNAQIIHKQ